ncbi:MAG: two-component sensor histidine kinase [Stappia sp.]|jgi:two-component system phosphate regulon sensor histidine kinase PhoR|nr:two-component sensor histidine kinase [Stappia sp.]|tara:strand:- start:73 stop:1116 length:1044 start_codon:yes stop_codon:yes gene_type:complete
MAGQSPRSVSIQAGIAVGLLTLLAVGVALWANNVGGQWWLPPLSGLLVGAVCYMLVYRQLGVYIQDRVRIIYKTIRRFKGSSSNLNLDMNNDIVEQVNRDVMSWAESQIDEITNLRETDTFRKEFIGNLAHELKTPIFNIQGFILTLLEGGMEDPEINRKFLLKAAKNVERMSGLLEDLDVITKMEAGNLDIELVPFDLLDIVRETIESLEPKAKRNNIELRITKGMDGSKVMVLGDAAKLVQVLTNLIVNSINYGTEGGRTEVRYYDAEDSILVEVADTGIGIREEDLPRVFERFYRVDKSRSRHAGGSGLGLAICKHIIETHGQTINVRSTYGEGSTFSFTLEKA